jgi:hypothetical protein
MVTSIKSIILGYEHNHGAALSRLRRDKRHAYGQDKVAKNGRHGCKPMDTDETFLSVPIGLNLWQYVLYFPISVFQASAVNYL